MRGPRYLPGGSRAHHTGALILAAALAATTLATAGCTPGRPSVTPASDPASPASRADATGTAAVPLSAITLDLAVVARGFDDPVFVTHAGDGSGRLFVVEQGGGVYVVRDGEPAASPFLDLSGEVSTGGERGLLGLAFAPDYERSGVLYVDYTDHAGDTVVARLTVDEPASDTPAAGEPEAVLRVEQPYSNHNGGCIVFGPDGYLWVGMGDGGSGGDPEGNGQDPETPLGKMLRLDVSERGAASAPADNPRGGDAGVSAFVYQSGLRNPWRFSFDRATSDLWIGDVGQNAWEEIDRVPLGDAKAANFGWNAWEGSHPFPEDSSPAREGFIFPVIEYGHSQGQSVTGGHVYRGSRHPELEGVYFYADYVEGWLAGARPAADSGGGTGGYESRVLAKNVGRPSSLGEDEAGEVYVVDHGDTVYRIGVEGD